MPPTLYKEVRSLLKRMNEGRIIKESSSPWAEMWGMVLLCRLSKLNDITHKDTFPHIKDSFTNLNKAEWHSTLDLASGYWQVEVKESDKKKDCIHNTIPLIRV